MANIRKQFNFRNGVQVDDDNLVVSPTGLVGIGTTVPTELLHVNDGNARITGFLTASQLRGQTLSVSDTATIENVEVGNTLIGAGISIRSGFITATIFLNLLKSLSLVTKTALLAEANTECKASSTGTLKDLLICTALKRNSSVAITYFIKPQTRRKLKNITSSLLNGLFSSSINDSSETSRIEFSEIAFSKKFNA